MSTKGCFWGSSANIVFACLLFSCKATSPAQDSAANAKCVLSSGDETSFLQIASKLKPGGQETIGMDVVEPALRQQKSLMHGASMARPTRSRTKASLGALSNLGDGSSCGYNGPLGCPLHRYTMQCSHNTYALGVQKAGWTGSSDSTSVQARSMSLAMSLGYRCIELDIFPWKPFSTSIIPSAQVVGGSWKGPDFMENKNAAGDLISMLRVTHRIPGNDLLNSLDLTLFVKDLLTWLEKDESDHPASAGEPKLPIVIDVESHIDNEKEEEYMYKVLSWLDYSATNPHQQRSSYRLVRKLRHGIPLGQLAATEAGQPRRVIVKSDVKFESSRLTDIVALPKNLEATSQNGYTSRNIGAGSKEFSAKQQKQMTDFVEAGDIVRTYPHMSATMSENYDPSRAFGAEAQQICINLQGTCKKDKDVCEFVDPGQSSNDCPCKREVAMHVENLFMSKGYDGYINYEKTPGSWIALNWAKM